MNGGGSAKWKHHEEEEEEEAELSGWQLVQLAETHMRVRNFKVCREYAVESLLKSKSNDTNIHVQASQILAISNIMSWPSNYYSILEVDTFCKDLTLIRSKFKQLLSILDPIKNKSPLANEAVNLVWKAYACLSDPLYKSQYDNSISDSDSTFWSFCPYCFYVYQYSRVFEGCCLRCPNQCCRRAFHGVALNSVPDNSTPTYFTYFPLGFSPHPPNNFHSWSPIVGMFPVSNTLHYNHTHFIHNNSDHSDNDHSRQRPFKRKSVAITKRKRTLSSHQHPPNYDVDQPPTPTAADDVAFFEEDGEIFVDLAPDTPL